MLRLAIVPLLVSLTGAMAGSLAVADEVRVPFGEVVHTADAIFIGTVRDIRSRTLETPSQAIGTTVTFEDIVTIHLRRGITELGDTLDLEYAGGSVAGHTMHVCVEPDLELGERYIAFVLLGQRYFTPFVGGAQGLYRLSRDANSETWYPLNSERALVAMRGEDVWQFSRTVERIVDGVAIERDIRHRRVAAPESNGTDAARSTQRSDTQVATDLDDFLAEIRARLADAPPQAWRFRGVGGAPAGDTQSLPSKLPSNRTRIAPPRLPHTPTSSAAMSTLGSSGSASGPGGSGPAPMGSGTPLCYCGYDDLFLTMEQVPDTWWSFSHNNDMMWLWNQGMDIYRYVDDDGTFGDNGDNEFCGWPSDAQLQSVYGYSWGTSLALTITWTICDCCQINQADVAFNPAYTWYEELDDTLGQSGRILYRSTLVHELGHSWGMQRGTCTEDYAYGEVSVMHAFYSNVVEDGWGFHHYDIEAERNLYDSQTSILGLTDIGVESYYADAGLWIATTDHSSYAVGESITVSGLTVENMTNSSVTGLRIRLYLSSNDTISEGDTQMGSDWWWDSFLAESYWDGDLTTTIPGVPPGEYYVGMIVTRNHESYDYDDLAFNDATFLTNTITVYEPAPDNDDCGAAFNIGTGSTFGTTNGATNDGTASCGSSSGSPDVWYRYTQPGPGTLSVTTCGTHDLGGIDSGMDTVLALLSSCGGTELACNDDTTTCGSSDSGTARDSSVSVQRLSGTTRIRVSPFSSSATGDFWLNLDFAPAQPIPTLSCNGDADGISLSWTDADDYSGIEVHRNGALIATLVGSATSYFDASPVAGGNAYTVTALFLGEPTSAASCSVTIELATITLAAGAASGPAGGTADHYSRVTNDVDIDGFSYGLAFDAGDLSVVDLDLVGTVADGADFFAPQIDNTPPGGWYSIGVVIDLSPPITTSIPPGANQPLVHAVFDIDAAQTPGATLPLQISDSAGVPTVDVVFTVAGGSSVTPATQAGVIIVTAGASFIRGDVDQDGTLQINDPIGFLNFVAGTGIAPSCEDAADGNDDGLLNIADAVYLLSFLFSGGPPPPPPYPSPGSDPTDDALGC